MIDADHIYYHLIIFSPLPQNYCYLLIISTLSSLITISQLSSIDHFCMFMITKLSLLDNYCQINSSWILSINLYLLIFLSQQLLTNWYHLTIINTLHYFLIIFIKINGDEAHPVLIISSSLILEKGKFFFKTSLTLTWRGPMN